VVVLCTTAPAVTSVGAALFLTHDRAGKRLVLGGDFPRELLGVFHGSLLSGVKVHNAKNISASMCKYMLYINCCQVKNPESYCPPKRGRLGRRGSGGGMPSRQSVKAPPPDSLEAEPSKILFSLIEKIFRGRAKEKIVKSILLGGERMRAASGRERTIWFQATTRSARGNHQTFLLK